MFAVPSGWIKRCAAAVNSRNGNDMASCLSEALVDTEQFYTPSSSLSSSSLLDMQTCYHEMKRVLDNEVGGVQQDTEKKLYIETLTRAACSVVVYEHTRRQLSSTTSSSIGAAEDESSTAAAGATSAQTEESLNAARQKLLKGLLFAFEAFQEAHTKTRIPHHFGGFPGWDTAALITLVHGIQRIAQGCTTVDEDSVGNLVRNWRKLFVYLQTSDNTVDDSKSRRRGALAVVNALLIVLFQHNNTHQCRIILRSIEQNEQIAETTKDPLKSVLQPAQHLVAEIIKFRFYQGRMKLYEKAFRGAFNSFLDAYRLAPPLGEGNDGNVFTNNEQRMNKQRTHFYLMVSGMLCGLEPPQEILARDDLSSAIFTPLFSAIRLGSPAAFSQVIDVNSAVLRRRGVYMLLQPARMYCYLYLLQAVHTSLTELGKEPSMIPFALLVSALDAANAKAALESGVKASSENNLVIAAEKETSAMIADTTATTVASIGQKRMRVEVDGQLKQDDMALWLARLVARGMVKGYLSYEHQTLVLSRKDPFPTISEVRTSNPYLA